MSGGVPRSKEIFLALLEVDPDQRTAELEELTEGDEALRQEVLLLLEAHSESATFLEHPAFLPQGREGFHAPLNPGDEVGPYRLLETLGEGGMGIVYLAEQREPLQRTVAFKVLKPGMDSRAVIARFETERQALAVMTHPGIARVHDAGTTPRGYPYFVMEYVDGPSLTEYCDARRLGLRRRVELLLEVCGAVHHAHQKGILHRDLKPSNLLVTEQSGRPAPKVIDFGVAKALGQSLATEEGLTLAGTVIGTPEYMSPEQADLASEAVDTRSDIYSMGVVLFELLTGCLPIDLGDAAAGGFTAVRERILRQDAPLASRRVAADSQAIRGAAAARDTTPVGLATGLRGDLDWILARTLEKDPELRYASISELAADLRRHLADQPVLAGSPTGAYMVRKFIARHRGKVIASSGVLLALVIGLAVSLWGLFRAQRAEESLLRLSDRVLVEQYFDEAETLHFAVPSDELPLQRLASRLEELLERRPFFEKRLALLRERAVPPAAAGATGDGWTSATAEDTWEHGLLVELVERLTSLESTDPRHSPLERLRRRRAWAAESAATTVERFASEWHAASAEIADEALCPAYAGLELPPQVGLVPLARSEQSGLWEFWHPLSGERPERTEGGTWIVGEETGLVFVLIPAGSFEMGARRPRPGEEPRGPNRDAHAQPEEGPVHTVQIGEPFFLSKYELTQGQWLRVTWLDPSSYGRSFEDRDLVFDLSHPVETVSHTSATSVLSRMGLALPTEAQWEYTARAGSSSVFHCGFDERCLRDFGNVRGVEFRRTNLPTMMGNQHHPWDDEWPLHAPVGCFAPNAFGLFDVHGNVFEWVAEPFGSYRVPCDPRDGRRFNPQLRPSVVARGGSAIRMATAARLSHRATSPPSSATGEVGLRPARRVELGDPRSAGE